MLHASNHSRKYNLTSAGSRLARYLDYVESTATVSPIVHFADIPAAPPVPPEQYDDDRPQLEDGDRDTEDAEQQSLSCECGMPLDPAGYCPRCDYDDVED